VRSFFLVTSPAAVKRVLQDNADNYGRETNTIFVLRETLGEGLLTIAGERWRRSRRLAQPAFHKQRLASFAGTMADAAAACMERWSQRAARGEAFDVAPEMARLTLQILGRCIFERDLTDEADSIARAVDIVLHHTVRSVQSLLPIPARVPTPANLRFRAALGELDRVVLGLIDERRAAGDDRGDLLSMLLAARDEETGEGLGDRQLRDEILTLLLAGHETTAMALSWTIYLLSLHPAARRAVEAEAREVLGDRRPGVDDLPRLRFARMVLEESMRLYPPAWIIGRRAVAEYPIGGFVAPARSLFLMSPYVLQRDARYYTNPERFDPDRWTPEFRAALPKFAYFPFGGGPRQCIGESFAWMELVLVMTTIAQRWRLRLVPGHPVVPQPLVTLRTKHGMRMTVQKR